MESNEPTIISAGTSAARRPRLAPLVEPGAELGAEELMRYSRQIIIPEIGMEGQRRLKNAKVLVIGAGGLGSPALLYLAAAGVGTIGIVDDDVVDVSNLQRQVIHAVSSVGRLKTESAASRIRELNPLVNVNLHSHRLDVDNVLDLFAQYDVILDGTDNFATRYLVNDAAALCGKPYVWGSILRFDGQVSVFWDKFGPNYRDLYPTPPPAGTVPSCSEGGVFGVLCAQVGSVMVAETIKLITGVGEPLLGRLLVLDSLDMRWSEVRLEPDPGAPKISELLPSYEAFCSGPAANVQAEDTTAPATVSAPELAALLDRRSAGEGDFLLVDVREPGEHQIVSIPGSILAPRGAVLSGEIILPRDREIILHCKSGGRSAEVLRFLRGEGYAGVRHLEGGILAWIQEVDTTLPAY